MKNSFRTFALTSVLCVSGGATAQSLRTDLANKYPDIVEGSGKPENPKILCPFHRMLERAGLYDAERDQAGSLIVSVLKIGRAAREFGCSFTACAGVASVVSGGQITEGTSRFGSVNVDALHTAIGVAHDCGLTFALGGETVSDEARASTLAALRGRADHNGHLAFSDLEAVKLQICAAQGVENDFAGQTEIGLIYTFLGGNERGFIDYADVVRFLHAELPKTIGEPTTPNI